MVALTATCYLHSTHQLKGSGAMFYVRGYYGTNNLGDAIQTVALSRLLPEIAPWREDKPDRGPLIVNGWLGRPPVYPAHAMYVGVFVSAEYHGHHAAIAASPHKPIGCRDPFSVASLYNRGVVDVDLVGCATLTLPRHTGPRYGELHVDYGTPRSITNWIPSNMSWAEQWRLAIDRLDEIKHAAIVRTTRLHVLLPCLAMGTPVIWREAGAEAANRFSLLRAMGVRPGLVEHWNVEPWANRFRTFLSNILGVKLVEHKLGSQSLRSRKGFRPETTPPLEIDSEWSL